VSNLPATICVRAPARTSTPEHQSIQLKQCNLPSASGTFCNEVDKCSGGVGWLRPWLLNTALIHLISRSESSTVSWTWLALKRCRFAIFSCSQTTHSASIFSAWWTSRWAWTISRIKEASCVSMDSPDLNDFHQWCSLDYCAQLRVVYSHSVSDWICSCNIPYKLLWKNHGLCCCTFPKLAALLPNDLPMLPLSVKSKCSSWG